MSSIKLYPPKPEKVYFYGTCLVDMFYPDAGMAGIQLLEKQGIEVIFPQDQTCCGQPAYTSGYHDQAREVAAAQLGLFPGDYPIVLPSGSCAGMMREHYPELFAGHPEEAKAKEVAGRIYELTEFLMHVCHIKLEDKGEPIKVAMHTSCSGRREMGLGEVGPALLGQLENVELVEEYAFNKCHSLRRVIMPGVKIVERWAFEDCRSLTDVECGKLETIGVEAFSDCFSLKSINLSSTRIFEQYSLDGCKALTSVKFGSNLERIDERAFGVCRSLEHITIPLKDGLIATDDIFIGCINLRHVDLVEGALHETVSALHLEEWGDDMEREIDSINRILPNARAGRHGHYGSDDPGEKAYVVRMWIRSVLGKIIRYKAEHESLLNEAATTLQLILPQDLIMNNVIPFLELPSHSFEVEDESDEEEDDN